ncbi:MAG: isoleucine--tRNA ligase [Acidobacteriota bacterium]|nr:isoleucine--tRNA ligase [Acidobacteriota bacterium]
MSENRFPVVESGYPFPEIELETLEYWRDEDVFRRSVSKYSGGPEFVFYDGPPTANNAPHVGHVVTRVVKDLIPRYRTMRGYHVVRKAGWDTHGLPVEIEVEKALGFSSKKQIEEYGVAEFNRRCLESVDRYEKQWREMVERVGHWIDLEDPYFTYTNEYIESVWWALAELANRRRLEKGFKIQHYCGRCGTPLSSHEVAQNYKDTEDPSVWVLFPLRDGQVATDADGDEHALGAQHRIVAWTTTPWTLLSHSGLALNAALDYRLVEHPRVPGSFLIFADELEPPVPLLASGEDGKTARLDLRDCDVVARFHGHDLEGLRYDRPFRVAPQSDDADAGNDNASDRDGWIVVAADYVTATEGTGIVHTAPLFGEDDYQTGRKYGLPQIQAVDGAGKIREGAGLEGLAGTWFKDADREVIRDLRQRGLLLHDERYKHSYAFCWRCDEPLLFYATESWFVRTTLDKDKLIQHNRTIGWRPEHVGEGRFGDWLENLVDWALSRNRYWGTPLPVWVCDGCEATQAIGSYAALHEAAGIELPSDPYDPKVFDPHRPYIDDFTWPCADCDGTKRRVEAVIDAWFDSGSMPFAQHHYPFENKELFERHFPADFISEAVDQTRGWFFTLHALGSLLFDDVAFRNCIVLGHISDESGRKMSKRIGNVVDPMEVIGETGADALRWYFCVNNPEQNARFSARLVREAAQGFLIPLWNALSFFSIYANLDGWRPGDDAGAFVQRPALDRWVLLRLDGVVAEATRALDGYDTASAAKAIEAFIEDLTNWYIRRSRDRFWAPVLEGVTTGGGPDKSSAYAALYEVLTTLARVLAPFTPFVADRIHRNLERTIGATGEPRVHLESWPEPPRRADDELERDMKTVQRAVRFGHAARNAHSVRTRQPLRSVTIVAADDELGAKLAPHLELVREELNVREVDFAQNRSDYVYHEILPVFPRCGPRFGKRMPLVQRALADADGDSLADALDVRGSVEIEIEGCVESLSAEELEVRLVEKEGMAIQGDRDLLVALDVELDAGLLTEGLAREVVHRIQRARKEMDLDYADRIEVQYRAAEPVVEALAAHREWVMGETLATALTVAPEGAELDAAPVEEHDFALQLTKR